MDWFLYDIGLRHERVNKMFRGFRENDRFLKIFLSIYREKFMHLFRSFTKYLSPLIANGLVLVTNEGSIPFQFFK